jgi:hypothetical protein
VTTDSLQIEELHRVRGTLTCAYANIVITYSIASPDAAFMEAKAGAVAAYGKRQPLGLGMMVVISADEPPPNDASRRAILAAYVAMQSVVRASVHVVEGEGFAASAKRSVITLLTLTSPLSFPIRIASTVSEGSLKMVKMLGTSLAPGLDPDRIATAVGAVQTLLMTPR